MIKNPRQAWHRRLPRGNESPHLRNWLLDDGSLTARLQGQGRFSLERLSQGLAIPLVDEVQPLGIASGKRARIREVVLRVDSEPRVFAHTVLPRMPRGPVTRWLARLGARSLGSMLFSHPGFWRAPLACRALDARHPLHRLAIEALQLPADTRLWARRSCFGFGNQRILVTEVFSPRLCASAPASVTKTPQRRSPG